MRIGVKAGKFSFLHIGHFRVFTKCASMCDELIVLVHDKKDDKIPFSVQDRMDMIAKHKDVRWVDFYKEDTEEKWLKNFVPKIKNILPNTEIIMFHSEELKGKKNMPGKDIVDKIIFVERTPGTSSSEVLEYIKNG